MCGAEVASAVQQQYSGVEVLQRDAGAYFRAAGGFANSYVTTSGLELAEDFYSEWRNLEAMHGRVKAAVAASGGKAKIEVVGQSLEGRDMTIVRFTGKGYRAGMPKVVLTFTIHAREWIAGMAGVYAVEKLVEKVNADLAYLDGIEVVMMPMGNPDGFKYSETSARFHRKNMNSNNSRCLGTDLNRNFPIAWAQRGSSTRECADTYHGREAGGEPETQVIMRVLKETKPTVVIDVHSYTQLVLSSWAWTTDDHPRKDEFAALGGKMHDAIEAKHGKSFREGPAAQTLYSASGSLTDYATSLGALGFCFELRPQNPWWGGGFAPPAREILPSAEETFEGILVAIDYARNS